MTFLETGARTHLHINTTLPSIRFLLITRWLLSPAIFYYKSLAGRGFAYLIGSISCLLGYWTCCGSLIIIYSPLLTLRRTDYRRNTSHQFSVNLECRGSVALSLIWEEVLLSVARFLHHVYSLQLGLTLCTECGSLSQTHQPL